MGHRLTKIYTRTGDNGTTGLSDGSRVAKDDPRVAAMGSIDEVNSVLGMALTEVLPDDVRKLLTSVQHGLFDLGGELSLPGHALITGAQVETLEQAIDHFNATLGPLKEFILPGGCRAAATVHLARAVCRRAERDLVTLRAHAPVNEPGLRYVNRLSDLLFVLARYLNHDAGQPDVLWRRGEH